jgi:hypothetical protein
LTLPSEEAHAVGPWRLTPGEVAAQRPGSQIKKMCGWPLGPTWSTRSTSCGGWSPARDRITPASVLAAGRRSPSSTVRTACEAADISGKATRSRRGRPGCVAVPTRFRRSPEPSPATNVTGLNPTRGDRSTLSTHRRSGGQDSDGPLRQAPLRSRSPRQRVHGSTSFTRSTDHFQGTRKGAGRSVGQTGWTRHCPLATKRATPPPHPHCR